MNGSLFRIIKKHIVRLLVLLLLAAVCPCAKEVIAKEQDRSEEAAMQEALEEWERSNKEDDENTVAKTIGENENISAVQYNNTNGLPTSEANDIIQTAEGFIWIGGYGGLTRYDGHSFEPLDSSKGINNVTCLKVDDHKRLWVGTSDNGVAMLDQNEIRRWNEKQGLSPKVQCLERDTDGSICVGTDAGVVMITPELETVFFYDERIAEADVQQINLGSDGILYCNTDDGDYFIIKDRKLLDYIPHEKIGIPKIVNIFPDQSAPGNVYIATEESRLYYGNIEKDRKHFETTDIAPLYNVLRVRQIEGKTWLCARNGIGFLEDGRFRLMDSLPLDNSINQVMEDYEGNLWFTSTRQGVMKIVRNKFTDLFAEADIPSSVVNTTCMRNGSLFVGTDEGLIVIEGKKQRKSLPLSYARTADGEDFPASDLVELLKGCRIRSIISDSRKRIWISCWRNYGLLCYDGKGVIIFNEDTGLLSGEVRAVSEASDGSIVAVTEKGLNIIKKDRITGSITEKDGLASEECLTACAAPNGDILVGTNGDGISVISGKKARSITKQDGLRSGIIMRIKYDREYDIFWIVAGNSIAYMTRDYKVTTVEHFPYADNYDLYDNNDGNLWILSSNGIYVVQAKDMLDNGKIYPSYYGLKNGLPSTPISNSYSCLDEDGNLYISGNSGVSKVNITSPMEEYLDLKMGVPFIEADGEKVFPDENGQFTISSHVKKLKIYGFVFNYNLSDPLVSYRLEGFEKEDMIVKCSELGEVSYTNLSGGSYFFLMNVKDAYGNDSHGVGVMIEKEKAVYERTWFYLVIALAVLLLVLLINSIYVRSRMVALEKKHREEAERERAENEMRTAARIQTSALPQSFPAFPERSEFELFASMDPAKEVGGDFYDYFLIDEDHLYLVIADVSGKGVPAALFMMNAKAILKSLAGNGRTPAQIMERANDELCANNLEMMFVTVWLGILEISTGKLSAVNAGHEFPALKRNNGPFTLLEDEHGAVLGAMDGMKYEGYEIDLSPGDTIFVYTDGVAEAANEKEERFEEERMIGACNADPDAGPERVVESVRRAVDDFAGNAEQFDDVTMLCLRYKG